MANAPQTHHTKIANEKHDHERALANAIFQSIGEGVISTDARGIITRVNKTTLDILGFSEDELVGKWLPKALVAVDEKGAEVSYIDRPVARTFLSGKPVSEPTFYLNKDGHSTPVMLTVSPIMIKGKPVGAIEVFRDMSKEYEIDQMKSEFVSIASHQLRTPLSAVKIYCHMLSDGFEGELSESQNELMRIIIESADRMNELIDTLLNAARLESGRLPLDIVEVNPSDVLSRVISELKPVADEKTQKIQIKNLRDDQCIETDPFLLGEVFANLISNAIKYSPPKSDIKLSLKKDKDNLKFKISDSGYGIPKDVQTRIFTKFFRGENILNKETSGSGLGLYMVKRIVDNLGGKISFKSTENKGTTFEVSIPIESQ